MVSAGRPLRVLQVVHNLARGASARASCLDSVLQELGHTSTTVSVRGEALWAPLRGTPFARTCAIVDEDELERRVAEEADLVIAIKPFSNSFGRALKLAPRHRVPLLVDVHDPDLEVRTTYLPLRQQLRSLRTDPRTTLRWHQLRWAARKLPTVVSTPVLQRFYRGELVPHARPDRGPGAPHTSRTPVVGFIGTVKAHKGVEELRDAVAALAGDGWRLRVTDDAPADARPWEEWVGAAATGTRELLDTSDVVVVASEPGGYGQAQLPLKLVDAMLSGRAVVVSDTGPLPWAAGPAAPVVPYGDVPALVEALRPLGDPAERTRISGAVRALALSRYTPQAAAPALGRAVDAALARGGSLGPVVALLDGQSPLPRRPRGAGPRPAPTPGASAG